MTATEDTSKYVRDLIAQYGLYSAEFNDQLEQLVTTLLTDLGDDYEKVPQALAERGYTDAADIHPHTFDEKNAVAQYLRSALKPEKIRVSGIGVWLDFWKAEMDIESEDPEWIDLPPAVQEYLDGHEDELARA